MITMDKKLTENGQKLVEQTMQASLQLLPLIMNNIPQAVFWKDRDLVYLGCNRAFADDAGLSSPEEVIGKTDFDMPWKDQAELYRADDWRVMEMGDPKLNYEEPQTTPDGSTIWLRTSKIPVQENGQIVAVLGMYEDITESKRAEEASKDERRRFQTILEAVRVPTLISRLSDGIVLYANQAIADVSQVHLDKMIGFKTGNFYANPDDRKTVLEALRQYGHINDFEVQFRRTDGSLYWGLLSSRIINYEGEPCVLSTYIDITGRKQIEQALRDSQQLLQTVMDNIPQSIFWKDSNLTYLGCNKAFANDAGLTLPSDVIGKTDWDMPWKEQAELYRADDSLVMQSGTPKLNYEEPQTTPDGSVTWLRTSKVPLHDPEGNTYAVLGMYEDITERKNLEQQVQTAFDRRGQQVQLSTQVSQSIAAATSLDDLYERVVTQVKEQFGYYHTQLLRYEPAQDAVVLVTGYGETGAKMLAASHRMPMGEGLIGTAAETGETVLRPALENDPDWHANVLLPETKGEIAVPIKLGNQILGVLDVQSDTANALGLDDQLLLEGLCGQIATAIENTRLQQEMVERLEEINRLYRAMSHEGWQTYRERADIPTSFVFDQGGLKQATDTGLTEELFSKIPLTVPGGEVIGTLAVADDPQRPISPEDQDFLQQISEQVALALESARLFEQTQDALSDVAHRAAELEAVARVSATTSTVLDPDKLLQAVVDLTKERFSLYHAHIYLADEAWQTLLLAAGAGEVGRKMVADNWSIPLDHQSSIVAGAARERKSIIANDVQHDQDSGFLSNILLPDTRSEMAVPMIVGEKVLGVFDVQSDVAGHFTEEDAKIYTTLAAQVAIALQNARLYVEQAATVTQLRELDRLKSAFLANMSHELRTPLNSILGFSDVILEELDGPVTEIMDNDLRLIQKNGKHLLHLINDVLDMAKIDAGRMNLHPEKFKLHELFDEVLGITSSLALEKSLSLNITDDSDRDVEVIADRTRIQQVMINLVNNAIKFTEKGEITVHASHRSQDEHVLISVRDTGLGIPSDHLEAIFQEFTQVDTSTTRKAGGTGLGLPISRKLIELHGGRLWAESTGISGEGSVLYVELPLEARISEPVEKQEK